MRLYKRIYHKAKHDKSVKRSDGLYHILAPSAIGICICAVCLCGASRAWFTATQTSSVTGIHTATYTVSVTAKKGDTDLQVTETTGIFEIHLEAESAYTITLTADGNAKSGYCKTEFGEATYYTPQIAPSNVFTFKVKANNAGVLKITPQWGTCSATENIIEVETTLELGTVSASDNNEPNNNVTATPQITSATPENTTPVADTATETTAPADTDEQSSDNNISEQEQEKEPKPEETTETDSENK